MRRTMLLAVALVAFGSGCKDPRVDALQTRVAKLETDYTALKTEHDRTREKLQALLVYVNGKKPPEVDLVDWIDAVHMKLWGASDPSKPSNPPEPF